MKKHVVGMLMLGVCMGSAGMARADDGNSVVLYGLVDASVGVVEHSANASPTFPGTVNPVNKVPVSFRDPVWGMFNGGISPSRWGIRGNENLGGGVSAFFNLESGFNLPTGAASNAAQGIAGNGNTIAPPSAINGQLFNRGAFVGLRSNTLGSIQFGRSTALSFDAISDYDPLFTAQLFSPLGFSGSYSAGGITEGSRTDNNIKYRNQIGPVKFGLSYSFGNTAGAFGAGSTFGAMLSYEQGGFGIVGTYYSARDILHSGALTGQAGLTASQVGAMSAYNDHGAMVAAKYTFGPATIKAGYEQYHLKAQNTIALYNAGALPMSYFGYTYTPKNGSSSNNNLFFIGGDYRITPTFDVALGVYDTQQTNGASGNQWQYSILADYQLSRRTDVYAGYMFSKFNGSQFNGYMSTNYIAALGMRSKF